VLAKAIEATAPAAQRTERCRLDVLTKLDGRHPVGDTLSRIVRQD
jgi:hypothetical protein